MGTLALGTAGFILYFLYDIDSVKKIHPLMRKFFGAGSLCVTLATIWELVHALEEKQCLPVYWIVWSLGCALFLVLLIYTLFFALPFEETYLRESGARESIHGWYIRLMPSSGCVVVCRTFFVPVGAFGEFRIRKIFSLYDFV